MNSSVQIEMAKQLIPVVVTAGNAVIQIRKKGLRSRFKNDASPVTEADLAGEKIIRKALSILYPAIPMIGEESFSSSQVQVSGSNYCFVVDPIDGTREYIEGREDFTVNIALLPMAFPRWGSSMLLPGKDYSSLQAGRLTSARLWVVKASVP